MFLLFAPSRRPMTALALCLVCGGGLSNLLDRLVFGATVVDFLHVDLGMVRTGIFNVADIALTLGGLLFGLSALWNFTSAVYGQYRAA